MSKLRLIPKLLLKKSNIFKNYVVVTSEKYSKYRDVGDLISMAKIFQDQRSDELIILNIDDNNITDFNHFCNLISKASEEIFMPLTVGGGINQLDQISKLLDSGADKVSLNSIIYSDPHFIEKSSKKFGSQCIVASIDYKLINNKSRVVFNNGKIITEIDPYDLAKKIVELGAGELILTSIDNDGMKNGLELDVSSKIANSINIPVIISGGCGVSNHFCQALSTNLFSGISAGTFFVNRDQNFYETRSHILNAGLDIRK